MESSINIMVNPGQEAKMKRIVKLEMKNSIRNLRFLCGVLVLFCAACIAERGHLQYLLECRQSTEGPGWYTAFLFCTTGAEGLLFVPLMAPFAAGADAQTELESRYFLFSSVRAGKRPYLFGKAAALCFSGGLMQALAMTLLLLMSLAGFRQVEFFNYGEVSLWSFIPKTGMHLLRGFLNGALWALTGGFAAVVTKNRYMACTVPFVLYYVLSVFQERYYRKLPFLNPRYWAAPVYYGNVFCIAVLLALLAVMAVLFIFLMKRRLEHV